MQGGVDWRATSYKLHTEGYAVLDGLLGQALTQALVADLHAIHPVMAPGRVGDGIESSSVRTDWLWRHKRGELSVVDPAAPHVQALHGLFDGVVVGLNAVLSGGFDAAAAHTLPTSTALDWSSLSSAGAAGAAGGSCRSDDAATATATATATSSHADDANATADADAFWRTPLWSLVAVEDLQFACYRPGGFYRAHSDAQDANSRRVLTAIYYLNPHWGPSDGGQLRMRGRQRQVVELEPLADRLILFDSRLEHEVLPLVEGPPGAREQGAPGAGEEMASAQATTSGDAPPRRMHKKAKKRKGRGGRQGPQQLRCAITQWLQDLAPPMLASALSSPRHNVNED